MHSGTLRTAAWVTDLGRGFRPGQLSRLAAKCSPSGNRCCCSGCPVIVVAVDRPHIRCVVFERPATQHAATGPPPTEMRLWRTAVVAAGKGRLEPSKRSSNRLPAPSALGPVTPEPNSSPAAPSNCPHRLLSPHRQKLRQVDVTCRSWQRAFRCRGGSDPPPLAAHACRTRLSQEKVCWESHQTVELMNRSAHRGVASSKNDEKPPGVWDPAAWCVAVRVTTEHSADYIPRSGRLNSSSGSDSHSANRSSTSAWLSLSLAQRLSSVR